MVTLTFDEQQLAVIDQALGGVPYRLAAPVVAAINEQLAAQQEPDPAAHRDYKGTPPPGGSNR